MLWLKILCILGGGFLNRIRGGLFDFSGNKLLFPLFLSFFGGNFEIMICTFIAAYVGQQFGWGTYIGALYGTPPTQDEVSEIDEIVNSAKVTFGDKVFYLRDYPRLWGFVALALRGLLWSFLIGLALHDVILMLAGLFMPICYLIGYFADDYLLNKGGKTAWNLGEWLWGGVLTAFVLW